MRIGLPALWRAAPMCVAASPGAGPLPCPGSLGRYPTGRVLALAKDGMFPAAIARNLGVDAERVRLDVARASASGRPIPISGSGPLPRKRAVLQPRRRVRLAREEGLGATQIAAHLGYSRSTFDYHFPVARRPGELPLPAPGGFANVGNAGSAGANKAATPIEGAPLAGGTPLARSRRPAAVRRCRRPGPGPRPGQRAACARGVPPRLAGRPSDDNIGVSWVTRTGASAVPRSPAGKEGVLPGQSPAVQASAIIGPLPDQAMHTISQPSMLACSHVRFHSSGSLAWTRMGGSRTKNPAPGETGPCPRRPTLPMLAVRPGTTA